MPRTNRKRPSKKRKNAKTCFVIMPIRKRGTDEHRHFLAIYDKFIKPTITRFGFDVQRADEHAAPGSINKVIISALATADLVIADITELNPNVFYELGIRHALKSNGTILLVDEDKTKNIPFDIAPYRRIVFEGNAQGLSQLADDLEKALTAIQSQNNPSSDNPVHDWLKELNIPIASVANQPDNVSTSEDDNKLEKSPEDIISDALFEAESGLLPQEILEDAHEAVKAQDIRSFLECVGKLLDVKAFQPSEREYSELYYMARRLDARRVSRAILEIGLRSFPDSTRLFRAYIGNMAHSTDPSEREKARQTVQSRLKLDASAEDIQLSNNSKYKDVDLLALMLDAYHRDGKNEEALKLTSRLVEMFPKSSLVLRNHARALDKIGTISHDKVLTAYRNAILLPTTDDSSAIWYAGELENGGRLVDSVEALLLACLLDLDEANAYALLALKLSEVFQPRNIFKMNNEERKLPEDIEDSLALDCILMSMSCPNFGSEHKFLCESAMRNLGVSDEELEEAIYERGELTRRDRLDLVHPFYKSMKSTVTAEN